MPHKALSISVSKTITLHVLLSTPPKPPKHPTLLLLHFWGGSNQTFQPAISLLKDNYNIIVPSLRGWGQSSRPSDTQAYRAADYAKDIVSLLRTLQTEQPDILTGGIVLAGHSMGGKIAQILLTDAEVVAPLVKGMVLIAPAPAGSFALPEAMQEQQIHAYDSAESATFAVENVLLGRADNVTEAVRAGIVSDAISGSREARAAWPEFGMAEDFEDAVMKSVSAYSSTGGARLQVLVIVGELDRVETPANVESRVAMRLRDAGAEVETALLSGVGHLIPLEAPERMASAIASFLARL